MSRPLGVAVIGCLLLVAGVYRCSVGAITLIAPGALPASSPPAYLDNFRLVSSYLTLAVGVLCIFVGWKLLRLRDWARFAATLVLGLGIPWVILMMSPLGRVHFGWRTIACYTEVAIRLLAIWYLLTPAVMNTFAPRRSDKTIST